MGKPPRDFRAPKDMIYYEDDDAKYVRGLQEQEKHRLASRQIEGEIQKWEDRLK